MERPRTLRWPAASPASPGGQVPRRTCPCAHSLMALTLKCCCEQDTGFLTRVLALLGAHYALPGVSCVPRNPMTWSVFRPPYRSEVSWGHRRGHIVNYSLSGWSLSLFPGPRLPSLSQAPSPAPMWSGHPPHRPDRSKSSPNPSVVWPVAKTQRLAARGPEKRCRLHLSNIHVGRGNEVPEGLGVPAKPSRLRPQQTRLWDPPRPTCLREPCSRVPPRGPACRRVACSRQRVPCKQSEPCVFPQHSRPCAPRRSSEVPRGASGRASCLPLPGPWGAGASRQHCPFSETGGGGQAGWVHGPGHPGADSLGALASVHGCKGPRSLSCLPASGPRSGPEAGAAWGPAAAQRDPRHGTPRVRTLRGGRWEP